MAVEDRQRWLALYVLCVGMLMIVLDATIVNVALPSIQEDLGFSQNDLAWVVNAYLIAFGGLLLLSGRIGDLIGQRRIFLIGLGVFTCASLLCALAQSQGLLIGARFVQGVGGALTSAVILGMIVTMFPEPREQAKAIGIYTFVAVAGGSIGLLLGGMLTETINWHWIFFVNLPIGIATALFAIRLVPDREGHRPQRRGGHPRRRAAHRRPDARRLHDPRRHRGGLGIEPDLVLGAISIALLAAFVLRQARVANPLMPLRLFRSRNVSGANLVQALMVVGMFGMFFLGALYMQRILGYDALAGRARLPAADGGHGHDVVPLHRAAQPQVRAAGDAHPRDGVHRRRAAAARPHAGRRELRRRPAAADDPHRSRSRARLPVADDAGDVGRHRERLGTGVGARQHERPGGRRDRPGDTRHVCDRAHRALLADGETAAEALNSGYHLAYLIGAGLGRWSRSPSRSACCARRGARGRRRARRWAVPAGARPPRGHGRAPLPAGSVARRGCEEAGMGVTIGCGGCTARRRRAARAKE